MKTVIRNNKMLRMSKYKSTRGRYENHRKARRYDKHKTAISFGCQILINNFVLIRWNTIFLCVVSEKRCRKLTTFHAMTSFLTANSQEEIVKIVLKNGKESEGNN
jgi:hypothetical protein